MNARPLLSRVVISNYRSISACDVELGPLTFLVGLNGAGKSNFIDALRFCRDALRGPLDQGFADRASNLQGLSYRSVNGTPGFGMRFDLMLPAGRTGHYSFLLGPSPRGFAVKREECVVIDPGGSRQAFLVTNGKVEATFTDPPAATDSRLYLVNASGRSEVRLVYEALTDMEFYNPDPERMKINLDTSGPADILDSEGENAASVLERINDLDPETKRRIEEYLRRIVPGLQTIKAESVKTFKFLNFEQFINGTTRRDFLASDMSDGTLRALAILIALFQQNGRYMNPRLVTIEEPETGLHPAAAGILLDSIKEAAESVQVIITSHSPDLLDNPEVPTDSILAVDASAGSTQIARLDEAGRSALHDRLYTAGELLRMDQLRPDPDAATAGGKLFDAC